MHAQGGGLCRPSMSHGVADGEQAVAWTTPASRARGGPVPSQWGRSRHGLRIADPRARRDDRLLRYQAWLDAITRSSVSSAAHPSALCCGPGRVAHCCHSSGRRHHALEDAAVLVVVDALRSASTAREPRGLRALTTTARSGERSSCVMATGLWRRRARRCIADTRCASL